MKNCKNIIIELEFYMYDNEMHVENIAPNHVIKKSVIIKRFLFSYLKI